MVAGSSRNNCVVICCFVFCKVFMYHANVCMIGYGIDPSHVGALAQDLQERRIAALLSENKKGSSASLRSLRDSRESFGTLFREVTK